MSLDQIDQYLAAAAGAVTALLVVGHALEAVVKLTPTDKDDKALGAVMSVLNAVAAFLPRIHFGKPVPEDKKS